MSNNKKIGELVGYKFSIPNYQRDYAWGEKILKTCGMIYWKQKRPGWMKWVIS